MGKTQEIRQYRQTLKEEELKNKLSQEAKQNVLQKTLKNLFYANLAMQK